MFFKGDSPILSFLLVLLATLAWIAVPCKAVASADCAKIVHIAVNGKDSPGCLQGNSSCGTLHYAFTNCTITNSTQFLIGPGTFNLTQDLGTIYNTPLSRLEGLVVKGSGAEETIVHCSNASGLAFVNITNLTISDLTLFKCSQSRPSTSIGNVSELHTVPFEVGLYIWRCRDVVIENVHISETIGVGLVLYETGGRVSINSSVFHHNGIPESMPDTLYGGGGVNIEFPYCPPGHYDDNECGNELSGAEYSISNCNFTNNTALLGMRYSEQFITPERSIHQSFGRGGGMAIYFSGNSSDNNVSLSDCHFVGNRAVFGGGLLGEFIDGARHNGLNLINCHFTENVCFHSTQVNGGGGGGARLGFLLYNRTTAVTNNEIRVTLTTFEQNKAYLGGGLSFVSAHEQGVSSPTNQLTLEGILFTQNVARLGSAVHLMPWNSPSTGLVAKVEIMNGLFWANSVLYNLYSQSYWIGLGTVYSYRIPLNITGNFSHFDSNSGSGLVVVGTGVTFHSNSVIYFSYNAATNGAAIAAYANGWLTLWDNAMLHFIHNTVQGRGGAIYSVSAGGHEVVESKDCVIRYFEWWKQYEEWNCTLSFEGNYAQLGGNDIYVSSLYPCIRSGSNGSADISIEARKTVFQSRAFLYQSPSNESIMTSATAIKNGSKNFLYNAIPGQSYNFVTELKIQPEDDLGAPAVVPFYATTGSNSSNPAAYISEDEAYSTEYLQFLASNDIASNETVVHLQSLFDPILLIHFNVSLSPCPPGTYLSIHGNHTTGQCTCAQDPSTKGYLTGISCYNQGGELHIQRQGTQWVGQIPLTNSSETITASGICPEQYCSGSYLNKVPLDLSEADYGLCTHGSCGIICGTCPHGIIATSPTFECCTPEESQALSTPVAWLSWAGMQISLSTVIVFVILLFNFDVIGGTLCSFVFFSQVVLTLNLQNCLPDYRTNGIILSFYAIWSLRFRWIIPWALRFCIPTFDNTLHALALDYVFMLYPFLLIFCVWAFLYCQYQGWCCRSCHRLCIRLNAVCYRLRQLLAQRTSLVHGIATCLVLTYGDLVSVSFYLLSPVILNVPYNISTPSDIPGGPWRSLYNGNYAYFGYPHYWFGLTALFMVICFGFLPPLFLMSYPVLPRLLSRCSIRLGDKVEGWYQKRAVHHLLELFQGHYKDNRRFFAGMWFFYRLVLHANDAFSLCSSGFSVQILISIAFLLLHSILQPYKEAKYNAIDSLLFANIALLSTLALWANDIQGSEGINSFTVALAIFLILPYLYFICVIMYRIANKVYGECCCRGQDPGERQPLLNATTATLRSLVGSKSSRSVRLASDSDSDSGDEDDDDDGLWKRDELQPGLYAASVQQPNAAAGSGQAVEATSNTSSSAVSEALVTA